VRLRRLVAGLAVAVALVAAPAGAGWTADASPTTAPADTTTPTELTVLPLPSGIELPNSGQAPVNSGDRGGWAQLTLFGVMMAAMIAIFVRVAYAVRQRTRARRPAVDA
jgi:hypothetical protein